MKKIFFLLVMVFQILPINGQNQEENLKKYWRYRDRLRNRFVVVNENVENYGVNIPAAKIDYDSKTVDWGDANSNMSHYLSVLATELWLLRNNNQDYSTTLKELYYAMMAMERLDTYSEYSLRYRENYGYWSFDRWIRGYTDVENDINGFHIRDDVSRGFWDKYKSHFDVPGFTSSFNDADMEEISQDNIYHNLEGLALVAKLVGTESVSNVPIVFVNDIISNRLNSLGIQAGFNVNFSLWARDFVERYIRYMQNESTIRVSFGGVGITTHWFLKNPVTGNLVREGSGSDLGTGAFYHYGVIKVGEEVVGKDLRMYDGLLSPPDKYYNELFRDHTVEINLPSPILDYCVEVLFGGIHASIPFDDYKLRSLSCIGNVLGSETFNILREHRDNFNPNNTGHYPIYEHFPLMYLVLHGPNPSAMSINDNVYISDQIMYEDLLNIAPYSGPKSNGTYEWSSISRCVWPEYLGQNDTSNVEYSGLDYMLLHNLYYIAFRNEDFDQLYVNDLSIYRLFSAHAGIISAKSSILSNDIVYHASNNMVFKPGFSVSEGKRFEAVLTPRPNNYQGGKYCIVPETDCGRSILRSVGSYQEAYRDNTSDFMKAPIVKKEIGDEYFKVNQDKIKFSVFPNPSDGNISVIIKDPLFPINIKVYSVIGILVYEGEINNSFEKINLSSLPKGNYIVRFNENDRIFTIKHSKIL